MQSNNKLPRISVITPSYNQGIYIEETIRSVISQDYPNLEYIIIDGGSIDDSLNIIHKYKKYLTYWVSETDKGQSHAINKGILQSTGEIISWLNSDDYYESNTLFSVAKNFKNKTNASVIYGLCNVINQNGKFIHVTGEPFDLPKMLTSYYSPIPQPSAFINRQYTKIVGPLDEKLHYVMDRDYWYRLALAGEMVFIKEIWASFRQYPNSKTSSLSADRIAEIVRVNENFFKRNPLPQHLKRLRQVSLSNSYLKCARRYTKTSNKKQALKMLFKAAFINFHNFYRKEWLYPMWKLIINQ